MEKDTIVNQDGDNTEMIENSERLHTIEPSHKVILINPLIIKNDRHRHFQTDWTGSEYPSSLLLPPMEFLHIHAALAREGKDVHFLDASARHLKPEKTIDLARTYEADLIIMTATYNTIDEVLDLAGKIRKSGYENKIALFGPPQTIRPESALESQIIDYVILGEPEKPALDLAQGQIRENLAFLENDIVHSLPRKLLDPLDWLPYPSRQLLNPGDYVAPFSKNYPFTVVTTSRGCSHNACTFCTQRIWSGKGKRSHSLEYVLGELEEAVEKYGYNEILFRDQVFTNDRNFTLALCEKIHEKKFTFPWRATTRVVHVDKELLGTMKSAGCYQLSYGIESISQQVLDDCKKGITLDQVKTAINMTRECGIEVVGNFVIGLKGDSIKNLESVADYAIDLGCDYSQFLLLQVWPGTTENEIRGSLSRDELIRLTGKAYRRFYLRPAFFWSMIRRIKSWRILKTVLKSGLRILLDKQIY